MIGQAILLQALFILSPLNAGHALFTALSARSIFIFIKLDMRSLAVKSRPRPSETE